MIGAGASYVLGRWFYKRKGRPNLLRETLPSWLVCVGGWILMALAARLGVHLAASMNLHGAERITTVDGVYFAATCVVFVLQFLIFHYVISTDPRSKRESAKHGEAGQRDSARLSSTGAAPDADPHSTEARDISHQSDRRA